MMLLRVQLLCLCWISSTVWSIQLKEKGPHHLFCMCSSTSYDGLYFWGLTPIVHTFYAVSPCTSTEPLHPACAFSTANNGWNAASHLLRERVRCKATFCWIVFPFFFLCHFWLCTGCSMVKYLLSAKLGGKIKTCGEKNNQIKWINGCLAWPHIARQVCVKLA